MDTDISRRCDLLAQQALDEYPILIQKISKACDVMEEDVKELLTEVMIFLSLIYHSNEKLTPSLIVDNAWHELILCTSYYHKLCKEEFGRYIHHHPGGKKKESLFQFNKTKKYYQKLAGNPPAKYWGESKVEQVSNADCGSCNS